MYSIVLVMAMTSGADTPALLRCRGCCRGCRGCCSCSCCGCYGCWGCSGCCCGGYRMTAPPPPPKPKDAAAYYGAAPATLVVSLPADARLTIDDNPTSSTTATRTFVTPALQPGYQYYYTLKARIMRDDQPVTVSKRIMVQPGGQVRVNLEFPAAGVAQR